MIVLEIEPVAKPRMTQSDKWAKRPRAIKYFAFRTQLNLQKINIDWNKEVKITFFISMPKSWSKKKRREMAGKPHQQRPDCDNYFKGLTDSLLSEDSHIWAINAKKYWAETGKIVIEELE